MRFYNGEGKIVFEVDSIDGKSTRAPTLADAKRLGLYLSVSTVTKVAADNTSLERWFKREPVYCVAKHLAESFDKKLELKLLAEDFEGWANDMHAIVEKHMSKAAARGSLIHEMAENYSKWSLNKSRSFAPTPDLEPYALLLHKIFKENDIVPKEIEKPVFDKGSQTSGTLDLAASKAFGKKNVLIDFKTQGFKGKSAKDYFNYRVQVAAYSNALFGKPGWCAIIYLDTSTYGGTGEPNFEVVMISPKESRELYKIYKMCAKIKYTSLGWGERAKGIK